MINDKFFEDLDVGANSFLFEGIDEWLLEKCHYNFDSK